MAEPAKTETNTAQEEDFKEETPQSSWDSLDQQFDTSEGADFVDETEAKKEPSAEDDVAEVEEAEPVAEEAKAAEPKVSEKPEDEAPVEEPAPEAKKVEEEKKEEVEETPPAPETPQLSDTQRQELRSQAVEQLAKSYEFDEETAAELETNPAKVIPKLAAELQVRVYENVVSTIMQQLPGALDGVVRSKETAARRENAFFSRWPELKGYKKQTLQMAQMWRQMNPSASEDVAIEEVGKVAMAALGLTGAQVQAAAEPASVQRTLTPPTAPPVQRTTASTKSKNPFEALAEQWDVEDYEDM